MTYLANRDPWMEHAKQIIFADYAVNVSVEAKNKDLIKFGRSKQVQTTETTLMELPTGTYNEVFQTTNAINSIVSTNAGDTQDIVIEGHTISGSDLTFVVQTVTLTGQTAAALTTPLARATRIYNNSATDLAGTISVTQTDTYTAGVPDTPAGVHVQIPAGAQQSEKTSTSISSSDFWIVTAFYADMLEKTAASAEVTLQVRKPGKVFRPVASISCSENHSGFFEFKPYLIVPPNSDIRLVGVASAAGKDIAGGIKGTLLA